VKRQRPASPSPVRAQLRDCLAQFGDAVIRDLHATHPEIPQPRQAAQMGAQTGVAWANSQE
jgi:hypothetical protein